MRTYNMRYSVQPKDRIYVKGYRFLSLMENMCKNISSKNEQKLLSTTKVSATDALKTASKGAL